MSKKVSKLGALALIGTYSGESEDSGSDNDDIVEDVVLNPEDIALKIILNDILPKVFKEKVDDEVMFIDHNPSFDVYRGRKREMSESSSVVQAVSLDCSSDLASSSSSEASLSSGDENDDDDDDVCEDEPKLEKLKRQPLKVKGEFLPSDLPPIEDLHISVPEAECIQIGKISSCVIDMVVVQSDPGQPALDLDSVLFLERGHKTLGKVFDVIGPIQNPFYCVRFNSAQHIKEKSIVPGLPVFFAPRTEHSTFVFLEQLKRLKGSDASWRHDIEPPEHHVEYSDDEEERNLRKAKKEERRLMQGIADSISGNKPAAETQRRVYKPPNRETQSGNAFYNQHQPNGNGSAFFRNNKRYRTKDFGPVQWNSVHTQHAGAFDTSRPPPSISMPPPTAIPYHPGSHIPNTGVPFQSPAYALPTSFSVPPPFGSSLGAPPMFSQTSNFIRPPAFHSMQALSQAPPPPPSFEDLRPPGTD